jgi:3-deoxy-D-manno-octulosonate 8-phosphate phosphatase (KDO 8-P phosphatase)
MPRGTVNERARRVRLLVMDVDGVLTDGRMTLSERGDESKSFHARDGVALVLARRAGIRTALVTDKQSGIAKARGEALGVDSIVLGATRKGDSVDALLIEHGVGAEAAAYVGDDIVDIPALQRVGLAIAVADAVPEVRALAHLVTRARGGHGAVRECVERILRAQGAWENAVGTFVRDHGGAALGGGRRKASGRARPRRTS